MAKEITVPHELLDYIKDKMFLASDAALARFLGVQNPVVSNWRHRRLPFGASYIIKLHELTGWPIKKIKSLEAGKDSEAAK